MLCLEMDGTLCCCTKLTKIGWEHTSKSILEDEFGAWCVFSVGMTHRFKEENVASSSSLINPSRCESQFHIEIPHHDNIIMGRCMLRNQLTKLIYTGDIGSREALNHQQFGAQTAIQRYAYTQNFSHLRQ